MDTTAPTPADDLSREPVRYAVDLGDRVQHLVRVRLTLPGDVSEPRIVMPAWTPGSYVIRDYARHVQWIRAADESGNPLRVTPAGAGAWRCEDAAAVTAAGEGGLPTSGRVTVELELYANDLSVRTNHVDDHHALLIPPATFPYVEGARDRRHVVAFDPDLDVPVWSLLPAGDVAGCYVAEDYDHLVDSAFELGEHPSVDFEVRGVPHAFVWTGHGGRPDLDRIAEDAAAIGEAAVELFDGDLPTDGYTFLCEGWDSSGGGGGLEHRDGSVLMMPVLDLRDPDRYARMQSLIAHEYLHLWNVKRLVPADLVELDYTRPAHTTLLWVAEGWTDHYDDLLPLRAGVWELSRFLEAQRDLIEAAQTTPGVGVQSVRQASYEAWLKLYHRDENFPNVGVNYYGHGALLAWCLDLMIRAERPHSGGLDDAFRLLWKRFGRDPGGYREQDVQAAVGEAAGRDLDGFFERYVDAAEQPPIEDLVVTVGLQLVDKDAKAPVPPELGVRTSEDDRGVTFASVLRDGPAWRAGLTGGDRLVAIDGTTVGRGELDRALRGYGPGERVVVSVVRGPRLLDVPVELGDPRPQREFRAVTDPTEDQQTAFRRWTGKELSDAPQPKSSEEDTDGGDRDG